MRVIILAAGQGKRLRPYTHDRPKCMVLLGGKPLLHHQLETLKQCGVSTDQIALVGGYLNERLEAPGVKQFKNESYAVSNMVSTLFCAEQFMNENEDLLICYGDIIYEPDVLNTLLSTDGEVVLAADLAWKVLWALRMDDPLSDAETFKMKSGNVIELGKKPGSYDEVQAQYMGLIRIRADMVKKFIDFYSSIDKSGSFDGQDFDNMYMTSLIQQLIDSGWDVRPALVKNGWLEVDTASELEQYSAMVSEGTLDPYIKL